MHSETMLISCLEEFGLSWGIRERGGLRPTCLPSNSGADGHQRSCVQGPWKDPRRSWGRGEVFLFSIPAGGQRCLVSGLRESQFLLIFGVGRVGGKRLQGFCILHLLLSPQDFLRLGLRGRNRGREDAPLFCLLQLLWKPWERGCYL